MGPTIVYQAWAFQHKLYHDYIQSMDLQQQAITEYAWYDTLFRPTMPASMFTLYMFFQLFNFQLY